MKKSADSAKSKKAKFNFKIKIVQTDLTCRDYFYYDLGNIIGGFQAESPILYQNSGYISKLYSINNFSGGILAKDKIEDMPERYKRFVNFGNPSEAEKITGIINEMAALANREEIGQNVFYSGLPGQPMFDPEEDASFFLEDEEFEDPEYDEYDEYGEEIRDILNLNNYYNSETYKMSKVEYDFEAPGNICLAPDGSLDIVYDESEMTGVKDSYVRFLIKAGKTDALTVHRKGFFNSWLPLEKGKRIKIDHADVYSDAVFTANTKEIVSNMTTSGGNIRIVYITETNGFPTEMIFHSISAKKAGI